MIATESLGQPPTHKPKSNAGQRKVAVARAGRRCVSEERINNADSDRLVWALHRRLERRCQRNNMAAQTTGDEAILCVRLWGLTSAQYPKQYKVLLNAVSAQVLEFRRWGSRNSHLI